MIFYEHGFRKLFLMNMTRTVITLSVIAISGCVTTRDPSTGEAPVPSIVGVLLEKSSYKNIYSFRSVNGKGNGLIRQSIDGSYDLKPSPGTFGERIVGMTDFYSAKHLNRNGRALILIHGASENCSRAHWLVDLDEVEMKTYQLGTCQSKFELIERTKGKYAIRELEKDDPVVYMYDNEHGLSDPKLRSEWYAEYEAEKQKKKEAEIQTREAKRAEAERMKREQAEMRAQAIAERKQAERQKLLDSLRSGGGGNKTSAPIKGSENYDLPEAVETGKIKPERVVWRVDPKGE